MTLIFNEEFAINPQSAQSGGGGTKYLISNVTKVGAVEDDKGVLSGFSTNNYAIATGIVYGSKTTYITKIKTGTQDNKEKQFYNRDKHVTCNYKSNYLYTWNWGTSQEVIILSNVTENTTYWIKQELDGTTNKVSYSTDGINYTVAITYTDTGLNYQVNQNLTFGVASYNYGAPLTSGSVDLNEFSILVDGQTVWQGVTNQIPVDRYFISNVTKFGAIGDNKGVLSGFSSNPTIYAFATQIGSLSEGSEVNIGFIMPPNLSSGDVIVISGWNSSGWTGNIFLNDSTSKLSSWDNSTEWNGQTTLIANHEYSFKLVKNSSGKLDAYLKEGNPTSDINDYTLEFSGVADFLSGNQLYLGRWDYLYFNGGSIDLNNCYIKIDGQTVWQGVIPQGTRG